MPEGRPPKYTYNRNVRTGGNCCGRRASRAYLSFSVCIIIITRTAYDGWEPVLVAHEVGVGSAADDILRCDRATDWRPTKVFKKKNPAKVNYERVATTRNRYVITHRPSPPDYYYILLIEIYYRNNITIIMYSLRTFGLWQGRWRRQKHEKIN